MRKLLRYSNLVKFYCIHVIPLYGSVMLILRWWYDYLFFLAYIWIENSSDSDDLLLTQMVIQCNTEVNDEGENVEDEEDDASFVEISDYGTN